MGQEISSSVDYILIELMSTNSENTYRNQLLTETWYKNFEARYFDFTLKQKLC